MKNTNNPRNRNLRTEQEKKALSQRRQTARSGKKPVRSIGFFYHGGRMQRTSSPEPLFIRPRRGGTLDTYIQRMYYYNSVMLTARAAAEIGRPEDAAALVRERVPACRRCITPARARRMSCG
jgi:hypothetical protein